MHDPGSFRTTFAEVRFDSIDLVAICFVYKVLELVPWHEAVLYTSVLSLGQPYYNRLEL